MGMNKIALPDGYDAKRLTFLVEDDFEYFVDGDRWTELSADTTATVAAVAAAGGVVSLFTDATNNNEASLYSTNKLWTFTNNKPLVGEFQIQFSEANTDDANVAVGFSSVFGANLLVDDGAGPATTMSGVLIYKVDGGTVWKVLTSISTTQTITTSTATAGGSAYQTLRIEVHPETSTTAVATFFLDGVPLMDAAQTARNMPITHRFTYTGAAAMNAGVYVKAGGANAETLKWDRVLLGMVR